MSEIPRRGMIAGMVAVGVAAAAAIWIKFPLPIHKNYPPTPYDDLLSKLDDREAGIRLGRAALASMPWFDPKKAAAKLRWRFRDASLVQALQADVHAGHLQDVAGWIVPATLAQLCALAAKA